MPSTMKLRLTIPKVLEIENLRLQILHLVVVFLTVVILGVRVLVGELYTSSLPASTEVQLTVQATSLKAMVDFDPRDELLCRRSMREEMWGGLSVTCDRVCPFDVFSPMCCVNPYELIEQYSYDSVFLLTNRAERCISAVGTVSCEGLSISPIRYDRARDVCPSPAENTTLAEGLQQLRADMQAGGGPSIPAEVLLESVCQIEECFFDPPCWPCEVFEDCIGNESGGFVNPSACSHSTWLPKDQPIAAEQHVDATGFEHSIYPSVAKLELRLTYAYEITGSPPWVPWASHYSLAGSAKNAMSVLLDRRDGIGRVYSPNEDLVLPVAEIIAVAHGLPDEVASKLPLIAPDVWLGGGEIIIYTDCFSSLSDVREPALRKSLEALEMGDVGTARPLCLVNVSWTNVPGVSSLPITWVEASGGPSVGRLSRKTGLRVRTLRGAGLIRYFDLNVLLVEFTSAMVILRLPVLLVQLFVLFGLGQLSLVYRRAVRDVHSIPDECGSTVCRLAMQSLAFRELGGGSKTIQLDELHRRLREVLRHRGLSLDAKEVSHLAEFCFRQVCTRSSRKELNIDAFCSACSSGDAVCLEHMSDLFDADRRLSLAERIFTPPSLRSEQRAVMEARLEEECVVEHAPSAADPDPSLEEELRQLRCRCAGQEEQLGILREEMAQLRQQLAEVSETCHGELASVRDSLAAQVTETTSFPARLEAFQAEISRLRSEPNKLHEARVEARLTAAEARTAELGARVEELQSHWRTPEHRTYEPELRAKLEETLAELQAPLQESQEDDGAARRWSPARAGGARAIEDTAEGVSASAGRHGGAKPRLRRAGSPVAMPRVHALT